jgi:hypothetical protein
VLWTRQGHVRCAPLASKRAGWKARPNVKVTACKCSRLHSRHYVNVCPLKCRRQFEVVHGGSCVAWCDSHAVSSVPAGSYWNGTDIRACPNDTFAPEARPVLEATACTPCPTGLTTNDTTGNVACGMRALQRGFRRIVTRVSYDWHLRSHCSLITRPDVSGSVTSTPQSQATYSPATYVMAALRSRAHQAASRLAFEISLRAAFAHLVPLDSAPLGWRVKPSVKVCLCDITVSESGPDINRAWHSHHPCVPNAALDAHGLWHMQFPRYRQAPTGTALSSCHVLRIRTLTACVWWLKVAWRPAPPAPPAVSRVARRARPRQQHAVSAVYGA